MTILEFLTMLEKEVNDLFEIYESKNNIPNKLLESMEKTVLMLDSFKFGNISEETYEGLKQVVITLQEKDPFGLNLWRYGFSSELMELLNVVKDLCIQNECEE